MSGYSEGVKKTLSLLESYILGGFFDTFSLIA